MEEIIDSLGSLVSFHFVQDVAKWKTCNWIGYSFASKDEGSVGFCVLNI